MRYFIAELLKSDHYFKSWSRCFRHVSLNEYLALFYSSTLCFWTWNFLIESSHWSIDMRAQYEDQILTNNHKWVLELRPCPRNMASRWNLYTTCLNQTYRTSKLNWIRQSLWLVDANNFISFAGHKFNLNWVIDGRKKASYSDQHHLTISPSLNIPISQHASQCSVSSWIYLSYMQNEFSALATVLFIRMAAPFLEYSVHWKSVLNSPLLDRLGLTKTDSNLANDLLTICSWLRTCWESLCLARVWQPSLSSDSHSTDFYCWLQANFFFVLLISATKTTSCISNFTTFIGVSDESLFKHLTAINFNWMTIN